MAPLVLAMAVASSCRVTARVEPASTVGSGPSFDRGRPEPAPPRVAAVPAEPPPPQVVVPLVSPFPPRAVVVLPVHDAPPVTLFPDEAQAVRRRVAEALVARGHEVVPVETLEHIEAAAAMGRLVLEDDQRCRAPLQPHELVARYFADRPVAVVHAGCSDTCELHIGVHGLERNEAYVSRRVTRPHDPAAWIAAVDHLGAAHGKGGRGFGISSPAHPPPVRFVLPEGIGPWGKSSIERASFDEAERLAAGCAHPDPELGLRYTIRASVDERGRASRCLATSEHTMARSSDAACLCEALERLELPPGRAGRRFRVVALDEGGSRSPGLALQPVQPGTEPWWRRLTESPALARCMVANLPPDLTAILTLALAPDGGVTDVRAHGDLTTGPALALARCMVRELQRVPLPCRPPGVDELQVRLVVGDPP